MDDAPAIVIVNSIFVRALHVAASDIHLEPISCGLRIRYRRDGFLFEDATVLPEYAVHVVARIKVLARIDIGEKRIPQDGKFVFESVTGPIDVRVATFPSLYGEKVVVRLLDRAHQVAQLHQLGIASQSLEMIQKIMKRSHGFFLVTGPTGSGKTTTLYSLLSLLQTASKNIVTLEDPIEYTIIGTTQGQIYPEIGFDFAKGIRAILRQDPDVIMIGEIRDTETAQTAVQAALTGHLVLSTLHTTDAPSTVIRLLDMGIASFLIHAAVTGILAQRLVRVLCDACKYEEALTAQEQEYVKAAGYAFTAAFRSAGCRECLGTGYCGRTGIFELLLCTPQVRAAIHNGVSYDELACVARAQGMEPLIVDALRKVEAGITSMSEVMRVVV